MEALGTSRCGGRVGGGCAVLGLLLGLALFLALPSRAGAVRPLATGINGLKADGISRQQILDRVANANASMARVNVSWRVIARHKPKHPRNPSDPAYEWTETDRFVNSVAKRGLKVVFTVARAPDWAEGKGHRRASVGGTWKPNARAFGKFAHALAARYSGKDLPRVRYFEAWNEPNQSQHLQPQWKHKHGKVKPKSPQMFKGMLNHFYKGVKSVHKGNKVIAPSTSAYGDPPKGPYPYEPRMRPVYFLRQLLCLQRKRGKLRPKKKHCRPAKFDIAAHHPIDRTRTHGPTYHAKNRDDAGPGDMGRIRRTVRAAEHFGTVRPRHKHRPLWVTEFSRGSKPPNPRGLPLQKQARWIEQGLYVFWKAGTSVAIYQGIVDFPGPAGTENIKSGLFFSSLAKKPAYTAFRFPFVTHRKSGSRVVAWGKAPAGGALRIQRRRGHRWTTVRTLARVKKGATFQVPLRIRGKAELRAAVGSEESLVWGQR